jgi:hypothetical protein
MEHVYISEALANAEKINAVSEKMETSKRTATGAAQY